jgi:hypothetical protein
MVARWFLGYVPRVVLHAIRTGLSPTVVVETDSCRWLKYIYFVVWLESAGLDVVIAYETIYSYYGCVVMPSKESLRLFVFYNNKNHKGF